MRQLGQGHSLLFAWPAELDAALKPYLARARAGAAAEAGGGPPPGWVPAAVVSWALANTAAHVTDLVIYQVAPPPRRVSPHAHHARR